MPAKNHLNPKQIEKLQKALREEEKAKIREKNQILLLLNDGKHNLKSLTFWVAHSTKYLTGVSRETLTI
jgi:hypothetical protein